MKKLHKQELFYNMLLESDNGPVSVIPENPDDRKVFQAFYDAEVFGISHLLIGGYRAGTLGIPFCDTARFPGLADCIRPETVNELAEVIRIAEENGKMQRTEKEFVLNHRDKWKNQLDAKGDKERNKYIEIAWKAYKMMCFKVYAPCIFYRAYEKCWFEEYSEAACIRKDGLSSVQDKIEYYACQYEQAEGENIKLHAAEMLGHLSVMREMFIRKADLTMEECKQRISSVKNTEELYELWQKAHTAEPWYSVEKTTVRGLERGFTKDGIIDPEKYVRYSPRVLVILKEPNIINDKDANGDHRPWYQEFTKGRFDRKKKCIIISDSEKRNADIRSHQKELIGRMVFLLQTCSGPDRSERKYLAAAEIQEALSHAAVMNLNKRGGRARTDAEKSRNYFSLYKEFIAKEIQIINPDIIIFCSTEIDKAEIEALSGKRVIQMTHPAGAKYLKSEELQKMGLNVQMTLDSLQKEAEISGDCLKPDKSVVKYMLLFQQRAGEASCLPGRPEKEMGI